MSVFVLQSETIASLLRQIQNTIIWNRMTASVLKQDPNIKRFKRTIIYFNTDTQYEHFRVKINKRSFERFCVWIKTRFFKSQVNVRTTEYMTHASFACCHLLLVTSVPKPAYFYSVGSWGNFSFKPH